MKRLTRSEIENMMMRLEDEEEILENLAENSHNKNVRDISHGRLYLIDECLDKLEDLAKDYPEEVQK